MLRWLTRLIHPHAPQCAADIKRVPYSIYTSSGTLADGDNDSFQAYAYPADPHFVTEQLLKNDPHFVSVERAMWMPPADNEEAGALWFLVKWKSKLPGYDMLVTGLAYHDGF